MFGRKFTFDDIVQNPELYGMPTFEEFSKNPEKFKGKTDELLAVIDKGSENLGKHIRKHVYKFKDWEAKSLEELENIIKNEGHSLLEMDFKASLVNMEGGKCDILVELFSKAKSNLIVAP